jgi:hypothetical protein
MEISIDFINGICVGAELVPATPDYDNTLLIDIFFVRILIQWPIKE